MWAYRSVNGVKGKSMSNVASAARARAKGTPVAPPQSNGDPICAADLAAIRESKMNNVIKSLRWISSFALLGAILAGLIFSHSPNVEHWQIAAALGTGTVAALKGLKVIHFL